jgi:hypothetical protein
MARRRGSGGRCLLPDVVGVVKHDFSSIRNREAADFRLEFAPGSSLSDRALHELLYALKWLGHILIFVGLGTFLVSVMRVLGITEWVAMLG